MPANDVEFGLITGSGLYEFGGGDEINVAETPYGAPSATCRKTDIGGQPVFVLPRHGASHEIPPHRINYRANAWMLNSLGARAVICLNTVGFIPAAMRPGELAVPDQLIDYTWGRAHTFTDPPQGSLEHVEFTEPVSASLRTRLIERSRELG